MRSYIIPGALTLLLLSSCGSSNKEGSAGLGEKKASLQKLKSERDKLDKNIAALESEIVKLDTSAGNPQKAKLVAVKTVERSAFSHYIELQGHIESENISYITPRGGPGQVKEIYVKQGDMVKKGQLLLRLDDAIARQNVVAASQGLESIKTQLSYAKDLYQRQKNLWDQGIGTEVQLITAKNNVATLENQLSASEENVKTIREQSNLSLVYSDVNGVADLVTVRVGESFGAPGAGVIKIVNNTNLKVVSNIPENYLGSVKKGSEMIVQLPDANETFNVKVSFVGASIDVINRGFVVEAKLPSDPALRPNQIALVRIRDYTAANSLSVPLNTLQNDEKGKFIMVANSENGKLVARKRVVEVGLLSGDQLEIKSGLNPGDTLVTEGYTSLYDGQLLTLK